MHRANRNLGVPAFSRLSGVTEWANSIFLWVNIGDADAEYNNEMRIIDQTHQEDAAICTLQWFAGSRMHEGALNCVDADSDADTL